MNKQEFIKLLNETFYPVLRNAGFKGSGQNFRRINGEVINAINIQINKYGGSCIINLGLHLTFLPYDSIEKPADIKKIKEVDCMLRQRLSPNNDDSWWDFTDPNTIHQNLNNLIETYIKHGEPLFQKYSNIDAITSKMSLNEIKKGHIIKFFGDILPIRAALHMARIKIHQNEINEAKEYAQYSLDNIGKGVGLIPKFEKILNL